MSAASRLHGPHHDVKKFSHTGDAVPVVDIDVAEKPEQARTFRNKHAIPFPIALDTTSSVFDALGFTGYPTHAFLDKQGLISCLSAGDLTPTQMDNELAVALARVPRPSADDECSREAILARERAFAGYVASSTRLSA